MLQIYALLGSLAMPSHTDDDDDESETPFPTLDYHGPPTFSSHLSPQDAYAHASRRIHGDDSASESTRSRSRRMNGGNGGRRRKRMWKKLMWVKQSCMAPRVPLPLGISRGFDHRLMSCRPGQLHRPSHFPSKTPTKPSTKAIRLLATYR